MVEGLLLHRVGRDRRRPAVVEVVKIAAVVLITAAHAGVFRGDAAAPLAGIAADVGIGELFEEQGF